MSRIGKKIIELPQGVDCVVSAGGVLITGPKGKLTVSFPKEIQVLLGEDPRVISLTVSNPENGKMSALWGLMRQLIFNAVEGVQRAFSKSLEFNGVGFRVEVNGRTVKMDVGFSHSVKFDLPEGIDATVEKNVLTITGIDKQLVGETAARIRRIKPPEPYKGKGIKYSTEVIRRKAGKTAAK